MTELMVTDHPSHQFYGHHPWKGLLQKEVEKEAVEFFDGKEAHTDKAVK